MRLWLGWSLATIVIGVLSAGLYCHDSMLNGDWIYDDGGTVTNNPFVLGLIPWHEVSESGISSDMALIEARLPNVQQTTPPSCRNLLFSPFTSNVIFLVG